MYRQPLDLPRIPRRTASSQLGDVFFLPTQIAIPEISFPGFFLPAGVRRRDAAGPRRAGTPRFKRRVCLAYKKAKDRLVHPTALGHAFVFWVSLPVPFSGTGIFFACSPSGPRG